MPSPRYCATCTPKRSTAPARLARGAALGVHVDHRDDARRAERPACIARERKKADLPPHFTPHCLRHTYASILLAEGKLSVYVRTQLGHASIALTVDTYGKWLPKGDKGAVTSGGRGGTPAVELLD